VLTFREEFFNDKTPEYGQLEFMTQDAVDKALRLSAVGSSYHNAEVMAFHRFTAPGKDPDAGVMVEVIAQVRQIITKTCPLQFKMKVGSTIFIKGLLVLKIQETTLPWIDVFAKK
jgi:hypothetical protein